MPAPTAPYSVFPAQLESGGVRPGYWRLNDELKITKLLTNQPKKETP